VTGLMGQARRDMVLVDERRDVRRECALCQRASVQREREIVCVCERERARERKIVRERESLRESVMQTLSDTPECQWSEKER